MEVGKAKRELNPETREDYISNMCKYVYKEKAPVYRAFMEAYLPKKFVRVNGEVDGNTYFTEEEEESWWGNRKENEVVAELYVVTEEKGHYRERIIKKDGFIVSLSSCEDSFAHSETEVYIPVE